MPTPFRLGVALCTLLLASLACTPKAPPVSVKGVSFYYWRTTCSLTDEDARYLAGVGVNTLSLRFFDVIREQGRVLPNAPITLAAPIPKGIRITPVVYVTRDVLLTENTNEVARIAEHIIDEVARIIEKGRIRFSGTLEIDCDWTPRTQETYFAMLDAIALVGNARFTDGITLTATIRLHQVKYSLRSGIPPVARGTLMVYPTSSPTSLTEKNTILDVATAEAYLTHLADYPLPLDIALPIYAWAVHFDGYKRFLVLINDVGHERLRKHPDMHRRGKNTYIAKRDTRLRDTPIMKGDIIKIDEPSLSACDTVLRMLASKRHLTNSTLLFYHYDNSMLRRFTHGIPSLITNLYRTAR